MHCEWIKLPNGVTMHVCSSAPRRKRCAFCPPGAANFATLLCDFETMPGRTCDRPICASCAKPVGEDKDYCPIHSGERFVVGEPNNKTSPLMSQGSAQAGRHKRFSAGGKQKELFAAS